MICLAVDEKLQRNPAHMSPTNINDQTGGHKFSGKL